MAEIKIEKKKPIWPWILLILIILGVIAYFVYENKDDDYQDDYMDDVRNEQMMDTTDRPVSNRSIQNEDGTYGSTFDGYEAFAGSIMDSTRIAVDSSYTKKAFANLAKIVVKKADENNIEESEALKDLREFSVLITTIAKTSTDMGDFKNFKTACDKVAKVLEDIQEKNYPALDQQTSELNKMASDVSASTPMANQQDKLTSFLQKSRDILQSMNP